MKESASSGNGTHTHDFTEAEKETFRSKLLLWYDKNKRELPWREFASERNANRRGYAVWVSEVMLQQTQVNTVIDYYNRWMEKWPTAQKLASASLEEVNELWSGLGYYSRARRLHEGAKKVVNSLGGDIPTNASALMKELPGVGRYTAGAIASIAFSQATGVVDGNVIRVLSRLRVIGVESSNAKAVEMFWRLAESLVDSNRPGDFNQAMMELGATVCTPLSPQCDRCPLSMHCRALMQVKEDKARLGLKLMGPERTAAAVTTSDVSCKDSVNDIEECGLCFPKTETWNVSLGVCNYPRKAKKKPAKEEQWAVFVLERIQSSAREYLIVQRPDSGLLAGLWEFPAMLVSSECENEKMASASETFLSQGFGVTSLRVKPHCSDIHIIHKFSHIHHHYKVYGYSCGGGCNNTSREGRPMKWVSEEEMASAALSAGMRKAYTACQNNNSKVNIRKRKRGESDGKQRKLDGFFKPQK